MSDTSRRVKALVDKLRRVYGNGGGVQESWHHRDDLIAMGFTEEEVDAAPRVDPSDPNSPIIVRRPRSR